MIVITIEVDAKTTVNIKTDSFANARSFLLIYAKEGSKIFFNTMCGKEEAFRILHNWQKEFNL